MRDERVLEYIGSRLKTERKDLGKSQQEFADLAECSQPQYHRIESGKREIGTLQLYKIASFLLLSMDSFCPPHQEELDNSEEKLVEAWRAKDLAGLLALIADRFS